MGIDFSKVEVASEQELIALVQTINSDIESSNRSRPLEEREEALKLDYILSRYRIIRNREDAKEFREKHECRYCMYYAKPRRCFARKECPLEKGKTFEKVVETVHRCSKNEKEICPYANDSGTCFGFCPKQIMEEFREDRQNEQQKH